MDWLLTTVQQYVSTETLVTLTALSIVFFVGSLIAIPFILVRLPTDFFDTRVPRRWMENHHPVLRLFGHLIKNVVGAILKRWLRGAKVDALSERFAAGQSGMGDLIARDLDERRYRIRRCLGLDPPDAPAERDHLATR